jgi:hypothetical protein
MSFHDNLGIIQQGISMSLSLDNVPDTDDIAFNINTHSRIIAIAWSLRLK